MNEKLFERLFNDPDFLDLSGIGKKPIAPPCNKVEIYKKRLPSFEDIWNRYVKPLEGKRIILNNGEDCNEILSVDNLGLTRISRNHRESPTPKAAYEYAYTSMVNNPKGKVSREDILNEYKSDLCSSIVVAVLGQYVPFIETIEVAKGLRLLLKRK
ncbi:MAG: hypothetical protein HDQ88_01455 [Clostridia bacterium]|nr:hypothetical protein [Clostridia bacterium]